MKFFLSILIFSSLVARAQVGIGTTDPQATLDVREADPAFPTLGAGIAIPQVSVLPSSGNRAGQLIYLTTSNLYYYYDGSSWKALINPVFTPGDVKYGYQKVDHQGWILLNGRSIGTLSTSQKAVAAFLNIVGNLPNIADKNIVGVGTNLLNTTGGSSSITINQNQLPNVTLTTSSDGAHMHNIGKVANYLLSPLSLILGGLGVSIPNGPLDSSNMTSSNGGHTHTIPINGGVTQQSLNIQNPYIALNGFIYLGL
jgi:hypothetical protein